MGLVKIMTVTLLQRMYTLTFFPVPMVSPLLHLNVFVKTGFSHTPPNVALMTIPLSGVLTHFGWETFTVMEHLKDFSYTLGPVSVHLDNRNIHNHSRTLCGSCNNNYSTYPLVLFIAFLAVITIWHLSCHLPLLE